MALPGCPGLCTKQQGNARSAQMVPMALPRLATTYAEIDSMSARNSLLVRVINDSSVLNLRADIDGNAVQVTSLMTVRLGERRESRPSSPRRPAREAHRASQPNELSLRPGHRL